MDVPQICSDNGTAGEEDLDDEDNAGHRVGQKEKNMGTQEEDSDTQSDKGDHQSFESCSVPEDADQSPVRE